MVSSISVLVFHHIAGRYLLQIIAFNRDRNRKQFQTFDEELIPENEVGDIIRSQNGFIRNIKEITLQTSESHKMASLGELSATIGHEINNTLNILVNSVNLFQSQIESDKFDKKILQKIFKIQQKSIEQTMDILKGLKTYSRVNENVNESFLLNSAIENSIFLVQSSLEQHHIEVETFPCKRNPAVKGNLGKLQQVIMNLISNSTDAFADQKDKKIQVEAYINEGFCYIKVEDNGPGVPEEHQEAIFDSFFTTKEAGKGTGLGLSICNSIIQEMNGEISFDTKIGEGTCFYIKLPISYEDIEEPAA